MMKFKNIFCILAAVFLLASCSHDEEITAEGNHFYTYQFGDYGYRLNEVAINEVEDYEEPVLIHGEVIRMLGDGVVITDQASEIYIKIGPTYENLGVVLGSEIGIIGIYDLNYFRAIEVSVDGGYFQAATSY